MKSQFLVVTLEIMDRMMDAGITTVKIKCQDAVGYLAVYRYHTYRVYIGTGYLLPHGTYYVVGPVPVYKD